MLVKFDSNKINVHPRTRQNLLKKGTTKRTNVVYSGKNVMRNSHFTKLQNFVINIIDKISPIISRHPKIGKIVIGFSENILKKSEDLSTGKKVL